ncbi:MAG: arsenate reductase ArsC, partial [Burkholderiaceae bacterium]|nr:arsenate reductase ArsC [Burkholderiaceae bacterium]
GFPDPSQVTGTDVEKRLAFIEVMNGLKKRIDLLASMPLETLDSMALRAIHQQAS